METWVTILILMFVLSCFGEIETESDKRRQFFGQIFIILNITLLVLIK